MRRSSGVNLMPRASLGRSERPASSRARALTASRRAAVDGAEIELAGVLAGILDCEPRLVGELAEIDLVLMARLAEHTDIGAGAEDIVLAGFDHHGLDLGVLEAKPLHGVVEL